MKVQLIVFITEVYRLQSSVFQSQNVMESQFIRVQSSIKPLHSLHQHLKPDVDVENKHYATYIIRGKWNYVHYPSVQYTLNSKLE